MHKKIFPIYALTQTFSAEWFLDCTRLSLCIMYLSLWKSMNFFAAKQYTTLEENQEYFWWGHNFYLLTISLNRFKLETQYVGEILQYIAWSWYEFSCLKFTNEHTLLKLLLENFKKTRELVLLPFGTLFTSITYGHDEIFGGKICIWNDCENMKKFYWDLAYNFSTGHDLRVNFVLH